MANLIRLYIKILSSLSWLPPLAARAWFGWKIFEAGKGKLFGNMDNVVNYFDSLGIPLPEANAYLAAGTEFGGGLLLMAGLGTRLAALPLTITMVVAFLTAHLDPFQKAIEGGQAYMPAFLDQTPGIYLLAFLYLLFAGPGPISVDGLIASKQDEEEAA